MGKGVATKFQLGGGADSDWGTASGGQNHLPPNSDFSSDFAHFILKILKNLKNGIPKFRKRFLIIAISGGKSPGIPNPVHVPCVSGVQTQPLGPAHSGIHHHEPRRQSVPRERPCS